MEIVKIMNNENIASIWAKKLHKITEEKKRKKKNTFRGDTTPLLQGQKVNTGSSVSGPKGKKLVKWKMQKIHPFNEELLETKSLRLTLSAKFGRMAAADYPSNSCGINGKRLCNIGKRYDIKTDIKFILFRDDFKTQPAVDRRFRPVSTVLKNGNRSELDRTAGQPAGGFEVVC